MYFIMDTLTESFQDSVNVLKMKTHLPGLSLIVKEQQVLFLQVVSLLCV